MSKHLKRLAAPRSWPITRKTSIWTVKPHPGPHSMQRSMPLLNVLRDMLGYCDTGKEGKKILAQSNVLVDGGIVKDHKRPIGLFDTVSAPKMNEHFRMLLDKRGKLRLSRISETEAKWKLVRIENKTTIKHGRLQINCHDGRNILVEGSRDKSKYKVSDTLKIELPGQKVIGHYPLAVGNTAAVIAGKHSGEVGVIKNLQTIRGPSPNVVEFDEFSTIKDHVFVVGLKKPVLETKVIE